MRYQAASITIAGCVAAAAMLSAPVAHADVPPALPGTITEPTSVARWAPQPLPGQQIAPQHPYLAANNGSNIHLNSYQTDASDFSGPAGGRLRASSATLFGEPATLTIDRYGHLVTTVVGVANNYVAVLDPKTLNVLSRYDFPVSTNRIGPDGKVNLGGGGYFYLDNKNRAIVSDLDGRIHAVAVSSKGTASLVRTVSVADVLRGGVIQSTFPDWHGRIWFIGTDGTVGTISGFDSGHPAIAAIHLGEPIEKSFTADSDGSMSIVTDKAQYRFTADASGRPHVDWRTVYPNDGVVKPGKLSAGSGSTPTLLDDRWVATTDNANPVNVVVYRRGARATGGGREVCRVPVFARGASASFQSLTWSNNQILTENNYGYTGVRSTVGGRTTTPGLTAIHFDPATERCNVAWQNTTTSSPSAIPRLSRANGLVYTITKRAGDLTDTWYFTALNWRTGTVVYSVPYGRGIALNNNYTPVTLGPDGSAYFGVLGGIVKIASVPA